MGRRPREPERWSVRQRRARARIAELAARLMAEQHITDPLRARRKAAAQLGIGDRGWWPDKAQVEAALVGYRRLFAGSAHQRELAHLRETACQAMRLLAAFDPLLAGPVVSGSVVPGTAVTLHLFSDEPEAPARVLLEARVPFRSAERTVDHGDQSPRRYPALVFHAGEVAIELVVLPLQARRRVPRDGPSGGVLPRADLARVEALCRAAPTEV